MKKCAWLISLAAILLPAAASVFAQAVAPEPPKEKKVKKERKPRPARKAPVRGLKGYWAIASKQLELTDDQKEKITELLEEKAKAEAEDIAKNSGRLAEIRAELKDKDISKEDKKKLNDEMKELRAGSAKIKKEFDAGLAEILTEEQNAKLKCYNFYAGKVRRYSRLKLTDEQKVEVRKLTDAACVELAKAEGKDAKKEIEKKLVEDIKELLTDEQKETLEKSRKPRKPKPEKNKDD